VIRIRPRGLAPGLVAATVAAAAAGAETPRGDYLVVHAPALRAAALEWARHRAEDGWTVRLLAAPEDGPGAARRVRSGIRAWHRAAPAGAGRPAAVLLLGDAGAGGVPAWTRPQPDPELRSRGERGYVTDHPYQLMDDADDRPDIMLGRVPVASDDEARRVLAKVRRAEQAPPLGPWRRRLAYAAGEGHYGAMDRVLETLFTAMVGRLVPDAYDVSMTYAKADSIFCPPPSRLTETVLDQLSGSSALFTYVGHGRATELDRFHWGPRRLPILRLGDLDRLRDHGGRRAMAVLCCCEAGWYDLPDGAPSLGEAMLLHPAGPVAVLAGSRVTHPYPNAILQKDIALLLRTGRVRTAGELDLALMRSMLEPDATDRELDAITRPIALVGGWGSTLADLRRTHVELYNLLGDPATHLALPGAEVRALRIDRGVVRGRVDGLAAGEVLVTVESDRLAVARPGDLVAVHGRADPGLEHKAASNYPIANERVLVELHGVVAAGRFEVPLPDPLPAGATVVKVYAHGHDADGRAFDAIGAVDAGAARAARGRVSRPSGPGPP
jgi:hypothetical protein